MAGVMATSLELFFAVQFIQSLKIFVYVGFLIPVFFLTDFPVLRLNGVTP